MKKLFWFFRDMAGSREGKQILRNSFGLGLFSIISQGCLFAFVLCLSRSVTPAEFGLFMFAIALQSYLLVVSTAGCQTVLLREAHTQPAETDSILCSYLSVVTLGGLVVGSVTSIVVILLPLNNPVERTLLLLMAIGNIGASIHFIPCFDLFHRQSLAASINAVFDVLSLLTLIVFKSLSGLSLGIAGWIIVAKWGVTSVFHGVLFHFAVRRLVWCPSLAVMRAMVASGFPLLLSGLLWLLPISGRLFMLRWRSTLEESAIYSIPIQLANALMLCGHLGVRIAQPYITSELGTKTRFVVRMSVVGLLFLSTLWLLFVAVGYVVLFRFLPTPYRAGLIPMILLLCTGILLTINLVLSTYLTRAKKENKVLESKGLACVLWFALGYCLTPTGGSCTLALITMISVGTATTIMLLQICQSDMSTTVQESTLPGAEESHSI